MKESKNLPQTFSCRFGRFSLSEILFLVFLFCVKILSRLDKKDPLKICQRINCLQLIRSEKKLAKNHPLGAIIFNP